VNSGDIITLGCTLESANASTLNHLPTELEIGIVPMHDAQVETPQVSLPSFASNSFHAPDTESEADEDQPSRPSTWKPFARTTTASHDKEISIPYMNPPTVDLVRDVSSRTSAIGDENAKKGQVDLTVENPWVVVEPMSFEFEDNLRKRRFQNVFNHPVDINQDEEDTYQYGNYVGFESDDNESDHGETQIPETQVYPQLAVGEMFSDADNMVCPSMV
jgi:hypothetical protein